MIEFRQHQLEGLEFLSGKKRAGLFFEQGLGKTLTMLEFLSKNKDLMTPVLLICPLSVIGVWQHEIENWGYDFSVGVLIGTRMQRKNVLESIKNIYIINYEGLRVMQKELMYTGFKTIILDESHRAKSKDAIQTRIALELGYKTPFRYILTGTPITKSPEDMWTQIQFLEPGYFENFYVFRNQYVDYRKVSIKIPGGMRDVWKPYRFKNLNELQDRTKTICLRKTKAECLDLPEKIYKTIYCQMSSEQKKHYYSLLVNLATQLDNGLLKMTHAASLIMKLRQVLQGFVYDDAGNVTEFENGKLKMLLDLLEDIPHEEKIIIFTNFIAEIEIVRKALNKSECDVVVFDGDSNERKKIVELFQSEAGPKILLANIEKAKEGITLHAATNVIYFSNCYNYGSRIQSEDRAHRVGQTKNVIYYDMVVPKTIDERIAKIIQHKKHTADAILGDSMELAKLALEDMNE